MRMGFQSTELSLQPIETVYAGRSGIELISAQPFVTLRILFTEQTGETMVKQIFPVILALIPLVAVCGAVAACP